MLLPGPPRELQPMFLTYGRQVLLAEMDIKEKETSKKARELRLKIQKNRTQGINQWHKTAKDFFLKGGQFVDAIKKLEVSVNEQMESKLEEIEKYAEIQEQKRIAELKEKRIKELELYSEFVPFGIDLGILSDEEYIKVFNGSKLQFEAKKEAERKAEEERKRLEEIQKLHNERKENLLPVWQFVENKNQNFGEMSGSEFSQLLDFAKKDKASHEAEQERIKRDNERLEKEKAEAEEKARKQREEAEKKLAEERAKQEEALRLEREKQAKLEAELKAKKEAEEKAERERLLSEEKSRKEAERLAKAPVKKQMSVWVNSFEIPFTEIDNEKVESIKQKFESFKKWALKEVDEL